MHWIDFVFGLITLLSTYIGLKRGAIVDFIATLVFVFAIIAGLFWGKPLGEVFFAAQDGVASPWALPVGFIVLFIGVYLIGTFIRGQVGSSIDNSKMRPADRMIGGLLGLARGLLLVLLILGTTYWMGEEATITGSWFDQFLQPFIADVVAGISYVAFE